MDAILNSVLFVLINFEIELLKFSQSQILPAVAVILTNLTARLITVAVPGVDHRRGRQTNHPCETAPR